MWGQRPGRGRDLEEEQASRRKSPGGGDLKRMRPKGAGGLEEDEVWKIRWPGEERGLEEEEAYEEEEACMRRKPE